MQLALSRGASFLAGHRLYDEFSALGLHLRRAHTLPRAHALTHVATVLLLSRFLCARAEGV